MEVQFPHFLFASGLLDIFKNRASKRIMRLNYQVHLHWIYIYIYKPVESYCFNFLRSLPHVSQEAKTEPLITPFNDLFFLFLHFLLKPTQQITIENQSSEFKNLLNHYEWKKGQKKKKETSFSRIFPLINNPKQCAYQSTFLSLAYYNIKLNN